MEHDHGHVLNVWEPSGPAVELIPPDPSHAPLVWRWRQQALARRFNPFLPADEASLARRLVPERADLTNYALDGHRWMVRWEGAIVGTVGLHATHWESGNTEIGYQLDEAVHGRGVGTAAVWTLVNHLYAQTEMVHILALIAAEHVASQRLIQKLGFVVEGRLRSHVLVEGHRLDQVIYGMLREDWARVDGPRGDGPTEPDR